MTRSPAPAGAPPTAQCGALAAGRIVLAGTTAPIGGGRCRGATARSWLVSRSAATRPGARPAVFRRAAPATPGPATSGANELSVARARPPRADGAASGSRRPSTTPPAATSPAQTRHGSRRGRSASGLQARHHRTPAEPDCPPGIVHLTEPTASRKAYVQMAQVFGTHRSSSGDLLHTQRSPNPEIRPAAKLHLAGYLRMSILRV